MPRDGEYGHGINPSHARRQGAEARKLTEDESTNDRFLPQDCPYGPGELADAWLAGYGAPEEAVEQVDTSEPTTDDVRREPAKQVRKGGKARRGSKRKGGAKLVDQPVKASTNTTGNAETSLPTTRAPAKPDESATTNVETTLGDPRGTKGDRTSIDPDKLM